MSGPYLIGVTGPIGSGKSEVCRWLSAELRLPLLDADRIGHEALQAGHPLVAEIVQAFGPEVRAADGGVDRCAVGARVFRDAAARAALDQIVHPWILGQIRTRFSALKGSGYAGMILLDAALLPAWIDRCAPDAIVLVRARRETRRDRLRAKGLEAAEADRRMEAQARLFPEFPPADWWILDNDGTLDELHAATMELWRQLAARFPAEEDTEIR